MDHSDKIVISAFLYLFYSQSYDYVDGQNVNIVRRTSPVIDENPSYIATDDDDQKKLEELSLVFKAIDIFQHFKAQSLSIKHSANLFVIAQHKAF